jgi:hypothetical protein
MDGWTIFQKKKEGEKLERTRQIQTLKSYCEYM